ncbi:MAG: drug/metabolite transporter (DMT)-like permease [Paracoccaceae bacterium]
MTSDTPPKAVSSKTPGLVPVALLFLIGALWGSFFVLIKIAVSDGVRPVSYLFWFTLLAGSWLFLAGILRGKRPRFARADLPYYLKLGLVRFTLANMILYTVQGKLAVGLMAVIMAFVPIFTYLISLVIRIEKFLWLRAVGILMGFGGVLLIVLPKSSLPDRSLAVWVLIGFGAPLFHAIAYVALSEKSRPKDVDSITLSSGTLFAAAFFALPLALVLGEFQTPGWPLATGELALLAHSLVAAVNFYAIFELIRIAGPTYMSQANFLSVGFGVAFGVILLGETHSLFVWAAIALMLAGVGLVNLRR